MSDGTTTRRARYIGWCLIAGSWALAIYLIAFYVVLLSFGPDRLCRALGSSLYNQVFPNGGFFLVATVLLLGAIWALPLGLLSAVAALLLRLSAAFKPSGRQRLVASLCAGLTLTLALHGGSLDGWPALAFPYLWADDTEFAANYSAMGFRRVRAGMTPAEVLRLAGEPLERYAIPDHPGEEGWRWSRSPHSADYRVRVVLFRDGRVTERFSEYYFD
jgi:hypothetical protein